MGFALPSGVVNTGTLYAYATDADAPLGPYIKQPSDQTLVAVDYSGLTAPLTLTSYTFSVDVSTNPQLVLAYPEIVSPSTLLFLMSGGIVGQQYKITINANGGARTDTLVISIPSSIGTDLINPVPAIYSQVPLWGGGYVNSAVRAFWGSVPPSNPNVLDQWFNTVTNGLYEWVTDGTTAYWDIIASPDFVLDATNDGYRYDRYSRSWARSIIQSDAPFDSQTYGRYLGDWIVIPPQVITSDVPNDGSYYARRNGLWQVTPSVPDPASTLPLMDSAATIGVSQSWARADHIHPSDTSKYDASNPANYQTASQVAGSITAGAYVLPPASATVLGGIMPDGVTTTVVGGVLHSVAPAVATISGTPPASPLVGQMWWDNVGAQMYIWYNDGNTTQWVTIVNQTGSGAVPVPPSNSIPPVVTGSGTVGSTLSCSQGVWTGTPTSFAYQWLRDGANIFGATTSNYTLVSADTSHFVSCRVTAINAIGSTSADSNALSVTATGPINSVAPAVTGTPALGNTLTCSQGTWTNSPTSYAYQWQRNSTNISGATGSTYVVVSADAGTTLSCIVTATNASGSASQGSNFLSVPAAPVVSVSPLVTGTGLVGQVLTSSTGTWSGSPTFVYQWKRDGATNIGTNSSTYTLVTADATHSVSCVVTATNSGGSVSAASSNSIFVNVAAPVNSVAPVISGSTSLGSTLTLTSNGTWSGSPTFTNQWQRDGVNISGQTASIYTVLSVDQSHSITCVVTATNTGGSATASSNALAIPAAFTYPGAPLALYSVRKMGAGYAGMCLNVRRTSDNTTQDIGFNAFDSVDVTAAATFAAGSTLTVAKWYDQSGNARDLVQATAISQPYFNVVNGKPWVVFGQTNDFGTNGSGLFLSTATVPTLTGDQTMGFAGQLGSDIVTMPMSQFDGTNGWFLTFNGGGASGGVGDHPGVFQYFTTNGGSTVRDTGRYYAKTNRYCAKRSSGIGTTYVNGTQTATGTAANNAATTAKLTIGGEPDGKFAFTGLIGEAYVYASALTDANRLLIDGNQNTYFTDTGFSTPFTGTAAVQFGYAENIAFGNILQYEYTQAWTEFAAVQLYQAPIGSFIIATNVVGTTEIGYAFEVGPDGKLRIRLINTAPTPGPAKWIDVYGSTVITDGVKHFVAATYTGSGTAAGCKIYVDGVAETMTTAADNLTGSIITAGQTFEVGNQIVDDNVAYIRGTLSYFQVDNVARSGAYIAAHCTPGSLPTVDANTVLCVALNAGSGTTVVDTAAVPHNGTLTTANMWVP